MIPTSTGAPSAPVASAGPPLSPKHAPAARPGLSPHSCVAVEKSDSKRPVARLQKPGDFSVSPAVRNAVGPALALGAATPQPAIVIGVPAAEAPASTARRTGGTETGAERISRPAS